MCGINGFNFRDQALIEAMVKKTHHRGPDDSGVFVDEHISLGHNRLSIIDLSSAGHQPMISPDNNLVIIFNGEIYNFAEIKKELEAQGYIFRSKTDTEVILLGFQAWGVKIFEKLNGIFALAVWDKKNETLYLARDPFGVKPLYYFWQNNKFIFSSEIKSILEHPVNRELSVDALNIYFRFLYIPAPATAFKNIYKLPAGKFLVLKNRQIEIKDYYHLEFGQQYTDYQQAKYDVRKTFDQAVKSQLISDRPLGLFLSGGFDSTAILGAMSRLTNQAVKTFTVGFKTDINYEEYNADAILAKKTAEYYHADHQQIDISAQDVIDNFSNVAYQVDDLVSNHIQVANYLLAKFVKQKVDVVLGGDGGDELFAGYERYYLNNLVDQWQKIPSSLRDNIFTSQLAKMAGREKLLNKINISDPEKRFFGYMAQKEKQVTNVLKKDINHFETVYNYFAPYFVQNNHGYTAQSQKIDLETWLVDESLLRSDKLSMAWALEQRVPILDKNMVELAFRLPNKWKINSRQQGKKIFIDALEDYFPEYLFKERKRGWFSPAAKWLRGDLKDFAQEMLSPNFNPATKDYLNFVEIEDLFKRHLSKDEYSLNILWATMTFQAWYKQYFK
jgi:asparagine synthase (glutamine-hydrolysing)